MLEKYFVRQRISWSYIRYNIAKHFGINWKTTDYQNLRILAVDEISVKKVPRYLTAVLDYLSGRAVWLGRKEQKLLQTDWEKHQFQ